MANDIWRIEGEYFESCNCEFLCPCVLSNVQARPTEGHCDAVLAIHIRNGNYGATDISRRRPKWKTPISRPFD